MPKAKFNISSKLSLIFLVSSPPLAQPKGGELTRNINKQMKPGVLQVIDVHSLTSIIGESTSSIRMWNIVSQ